MSFAQLVGSTLLVVALVLALFALDGAAPIFYLISSMFAFASTISFVVDMAGNRH